MDDSAPHDWQSGGFPPTCEQKVKTDEPAGSTTDGRRGMESESKAVARWKGQAVEEKDRPQLCSLSTMRMEHLPARASKGGIVHSIAQGNLRSFPGCAATARCTLFHNAAACLELHWSRWLADQLPVLRKLSSKLSKHWAVDHACASHGVRGAPSRAPFPIAEPRPLSHPTVGGVSETPPPRSAP
eukprot:scaffold1724_cov341-Pavlova_lutheri.AAC.50